jgi:hypothetical protein
MKAMFVEIGATTLEQMNAVAPEVVAHIMAEAGYTADDLTSDGAAFEEVREREAEVGVKAVSAQERQAGSVVGSLDAGLRDTVSAHAAVRTALDGVDPNYAVYAEEKRILREIGSNEKPKSLDGIASLDEKALQSFFDAANAQPAPPPSPDDPASWSAEKADAWLRHNVKEPDPVQTVTVGADGRTSSPLPGVEQMIRENESDDARRAKTAKPQDNYSKFFTTE